MSITNQIKAAINSQFLRKAGKDTAYYTLAQVGSKLISILALPFLARELNAEDFSTYDIFLILSNFLMLIITLGSDSGLVVGLIDKERKTMKNKLLSLATLIIFISWACVFLLILTASPIINKYVPFFYLSIAVFYALVSALQSLFTAFLRWTDHAKEAAIITFVSNVFGIIIGLILAFINREHFLQYFIGGLFAGSLLSLTISLFFVKKFFSSISLKEDMPFLKEFLFYSLPYVPGSLVNNVLVNMDRIIIIPLFSTSVYATYAFCSRIAQIPRLGLSIIGTGIQPSLLSDYESYQGKRRIKKTYESFVLMFILIVAAAIVLSIPLIQLFGGDKYLEANRILPVLLATSLFASSIYFNGWGYTITKRTKDLGILLFVFAVINFPVNYFMAKYYGLAEMLFVSMILNACLSLTYTYRSEQLYSFKYNLRLIVGSILVIIILVALSMYY